MRPLEGGITNRNFRVRLRRRRLRGAASPARTPSLLGIDREAERDRDERPPRHRHRRREVAAFLAEPPCLVTALRRRASDDRRTSCAAETIWPRSRAPCAAMHDWARAADRLRLVPARRGLRATARERAGRPMPAGVRRGAASCAARIERGRGQPRHEPVPCHNDLLTANFLRDGDRVWIVDWEYAGMGDRFFDLGNFAVNNELDDGRRGAAARGLLRRAADAAARARRCS